MSTNTPNTPSPESTPDAGEAGTSGRDGRCNHHDRGCGPRGRHGRGRFVRRAIFLLTLGTVGVFAVRGAVAGAGGPWGCHGGGAESAAEVREHMGVMSDRALAALGATDAQRATIDGILDEAAPQAWGFKEEVRALRERFRAALLAEPVDQVALETVRKEALALADRASAQALDDVIEASQTLTPEQRTRLARWAEKVHGERGRHGRH
jgi:Spy/CpxP family protein refolding chaperone